MQGPGGALVGRIGARFPGVVRGGVLDRDELRRRVLGEPAELAALEAIVHPAVREARERFIARHRDAPALLFEIPLLFETGGDDGVRQDRRRVGACRGAARAGAVAAGHDRGELDSILARQLPDSDKRARADFVIDTSGDLSTTKAQVAEIIACLGLAADS